ncbi:MAG TPA: hypothetical protein V6D28_00990 [Leptolyngbyaceae cyanobacterium]
MLLTKHIVYEPSRRFISTTIGSSRERHLCPCCATILLRHIRWEGVYWRCSYCYQEMPI